MTLNYLSGPNVIIRILIRERQRCQGERCECVILLAVKVEEP